MAFSLAALILFIPANVFPILSITKMGYESKSTILGGVIDLWSDGTWGIASIVLFCSIVIPLTKIAALFYLCVSWKKQAANRNSFLLRWIELIGRWSMLDVFLVAILVSLVKLGTIATVQPEIGIVAFSSVVVLTMFASTNLDSRLFWHQHE
jgi:paraquat-inducible protein A|tara:strand:- start:599 stop:1054 length:456 start_codon:yes stop_codon:yes gene_type:complete